ncbi:response regulator [uncultured Desulfosarcina sp.]|uniref:response regulator n=1 Tax=uncultured Desulfosarcina sp. TaxID=218289 RepID=UPI0029C7D039|nr:response regulator [uncultured Desulfosarcina sp.]
MENAKEILIADRNPHIRGFLKRELSACGYNVRLAENGKELMKLIYSRIRIDLLVLDPDFPGVDPNVMARKIVDRVPQLPVVLYCIRGADDLSDFIAGNVFHVEKNGQSIEILKEVIHAILIGAIIHPPFSLKQQG